MTVQIENINKSFGTDVILENVSLIASDNERIGLVGPNGAGKTTLLKIIAGDIGYDSGRLMIPKACRVGFLRQNSILAENLSIYEYMLGAFDDVIRLEEEMRLLEQQMGGDISEAEHDRILKSYGEKSEMFEKRGGFEMKARISSILNGMGFGGFDNNMKISNLSGGEKTKLSMARLLLEAPDLLLLDEPTNHLDFKTMQWLEGYLKGYKGIVITVSHDRYFLDSVVNTIYEIEQNRMERYSGNYSAYVELKKQNIAVRMKHYNAQREEIKRLEEYVAKNGVRASTAKSAKSKQKAIDRMVLDEKPTVMNKTCRFAFDGVFRSYNDVLTAEDVRLKVPKNGILESIAEGISFDVKRGEKIGIVGANGIGKSTLLKSILGMHEYYDGEIELGRNIKLSYYDQEQRLLSDEKTIFAEISDRFPLMDEVDIRSRLGGVLFTEEDAFKIVGELSGGERARLMFLIIMLEKPNFMILDEPTNHLDLPAKEALDEAIASYEGTVLFVSHDRYFLNKTADKIYELTSDGIVKYNGNYDSYVAALCERESTENTAAVKAEAKVNDYEMQKKHQSMVRSLTRKIETAEKNIAEFENKIKSVDTELENCGADFEKAKQLYEEKQLYELGLNESYELWESCTAQLEQLEKVN